MRQEMWREVLGRHPQPQLLLLHGNGEQPLRRIRDGKAVPSTCLQFGSGGLGRLVVMVTIIITNVTVSFDY